MRIVAKSLSFLCIALQIIALSLAGKVRYPPAELCNPQTLEGCQGRQAEFAEVWRSRSLPKQLQMLKSLQKKIRYEDEADWIDDQIIILENVIEYTKATKGEL
mmetsp:Transcript_9468/g.19965  ORF Transcript_9468/g.19965 Transcript_9468/m.19965 type:complete len:103 (+) Transcript_9468:343-651(+)